MYVNRTCVLKYDIGSIFGFDKNFSYVTLRFVLNSLRKLISTDRREILVRNLGPLNRYIQISTNIILSR